MGCGRAGGGGEEERSLRNGFDQKAASREGECVGTPLVQMTPERLYLCRKTKDGILLYFFARERTAETDGAPQTTHGHHI